MKRERGLQISAIKSFSALFLAATLSACSASSIQRVGHDVSQYAPDSYRQTQQNLYTISYLDEGYSGVRKAREEDAYKKMFAHCGGKYSIVEDKYIFSFWGANRVFYFDCIKGF